MADNEYPRALYRKGTQEPVWGRMVDLLLVNDADELEAAQVEGWHLRPDGFDQEPPPTPSLFSILDEKVSTIVEQFPAMTKDELKQLLDAEQAGKTRKGLIDALEAAITALETPEPAANA